ncbi:hypothetical protein NDU88_001952 [Pleurodeles waltl]|uniref:Uncharacterized protein n=1 Tax=Pleurodeles waltl TaxID=8319 RepID=A0AAV7V958_PLEWA|nr:hypothetical protein NDU88_001952 [Pleurodeles waltl]
MPGSKVRSRGGTKKGLKTRPKAKEFTEKHPSLGLSLGNQDEEGGEKVLQPSGQKDVLRDNRADRDNYERSSGTPLGVSIREFVGRYFKKTHQTSQLSEESNIFDANQSEIERSRRNEFPISDSLQMEDLFLERRSEEVTGRKGSEGEEVTKALFYSEFIRRLVLQAEAELMKEGIRLEPQNVLRVTTCNAYRGQESVYLPKRFCFCSLLNSSFVVRTNSSPLLNLHASVQNNTPYDSS